MIIGECGHIDSNCNGCGKKLVAEVLKSSAGYYIGTMCMCGPFSRESGYYKTRDEIVIAACNGVILRDGTVFQSSRL